MLVRRTRPRPERNPKSAGGGGKAMVFQHCPDYMEIIGNIVDSSGGTCLDCFGIVVSASEISTENPIVPLKGLKVHGNLLYGGLFGIQLGDGIDDDIGSDAEVYNNTIHHRSGIDPGDNYGAFSVRSDYDGEIRNNLTFESRVLHCNSTGDTDSGTITHNGWFGDSGEQASCDDTENSNCEVCDSGTDTTEEDPDFAEVISASYTLKSTSDAIDAGYDVGLDFNGSAPDLGAFEFVPGGGPRPTVEICGCPATHQLCEYDIGCPE